MKEQIEDLTLIKILGKGSYGEVYLSKNKILINYFQPRK